MTETGTAIVISSPSGGGKTSLCHELARRLPNLVFSISHTTRPLRAGEVHGRDYHFVSEEVFQHMIEQQAFAEFARVHNHWYGTSKAALYQHLNAGVDVMLDIDVQGGEQIARIITPALRIFILPPSLSVLRQRLEMRQRESLDELERRMLGAVHEIQQAKAYDYLLINDRFEEAVQEMVHIVQAQRIKMRSKETLIQNVLNPDTVV